VTPSFIDSNILVYYFTGNHPDYSPRCAALLDRLDRGEETAWCTSTVIMETAFVLERPLSIPRHLIAPALSDFVSIPAISFDFRDTILQAISIWAGNGPLSLPDAYHLAFTEQQGLSRIYTFDRKMNRYPGVERIEP
jgi:predicted nucleic acid-binding protein